MNIVTIKQTLSSELLSYIAKTQISKTSLGFKLGTNVIGINHHLDPKSLRIDLGSTIKLAEMLGYDLEISLKPKTEVLDTY